MNWGFPTALFGLWLLPLIGFLLFRNQRQLRSAAALFAEPAMLVRLLPQCDAWRTWLKAGLLMTAVGLLVVAVARPRFGIYFEQAATRGVDLFVVLDVSRSMLAQDVRPSRLERAKSDILDLLSRLEGDRVGLIVFAGAPVVQVPLTMDHGFFRIALNDVDTDSAPRGGTMIGDAIRKAMESMDAQPDRDQAIVLITDGGDQDSFPREAAEQAAERNIRMITVGLGDTGEGARIPKRTEAGGLSYVQHDGQEVWSKMDETLLKDLATTSSGAYVPAQTFAYDLGKIYDDHLARLTQGELHSEKRQRFREQYQWFALLGLIALVAEMLIPSHRSDNSG